LGGQTPSKNVQLQIAAATWRIETRSVCAFSQITLDLLLLLLTAVDVWDTRRWAGRRWRLRLDTSVKVVQIVSLACIVVCHIEQKTKTRHTSVK